MIVSDNTRETEGIGNFIENRRKISAEMGRKKAAK